LFVEDDGLSATIVIETMPSASSTMYDAGSNWTENSAGEK